MSTKEDKAALKARCIEILDPLEEKGMKGDAEGKRKPFTEEQKKLLMQIFDIWNTPHKDVKNKLASVLGTSYPRVTNWFANKRASLKPKKKKSKRKREDEGPKKKKKTEEEKSAPPKKKKKKEQTFEECMAFLNSEHPDHPEDAYLEESEDSASPKKKAKKKKKKKKRKRDADTPPRKKRRSGLEEFGLELADLGPITSRRSSRRGDRPYFNYVFGLSEDIGRNENMNLCFMNAAFQGIWHTPKIAEYFITQKYKEDAERLSKDGRDRTFAMNFGNFICKIHRESLKNRRAYQDEFIELMYSVVANPSTSWVELGVQEDSNNFISSVLQTFSEDFDVKEDKRNIIRDNFLGTMNIETTCQVCQKSRSKTEDYTQINLPIANEETLDFTYTLIDPEIKTPSIEKKTKIARDTENIAELVATELRQTEPECEELILFKYNAKSYKLEQFETEDPTIITNTENVYLIKKDPTKHESAGGEVHCEIYFTFTETMETFDDSLMPRIWALPKKCTKKRLMKHIKKRLSLVCPKGKKGDELFDIAIRDKEDTKGVSMEGNIKWPEKPIVKIRCYGEMLKLYKKKKNSLVKRRGSSFALDLDTLLERYQEPEEVDVPVECTHCKAKTESTRRIYFENNPRTLLVTLSRFKQCGAERVKIKKKINCPQTLDFNDTIYNLYATIQHDGIVEEGHYVAHVKPKGVNKWSKINDSIVSELQQDMVVDKDTYILFYREKD